MDRYSKLATLALLGSASATVTPTVRMVGVNPMQYDELANTTGGDLRTTTSDNQTLPASYTALTATTLMSPYSCVRSAGNYFFPQKYTANVPVTGAQTFYIHDKDLTVAALKVAGGKAISAFTWDAGNSQITATTTERVWDTDEFYNTITTKADNSLDTASYKNKSQMGRSACCPKISDGQNADTQCGHQLDQSSISAAIANTKGSVQTGVSVGFIPKGRIWYRAPETLNAWATNITHRCIFSVIPAAAATTKLCRKLDADATATALGTTAVTNAVKLDETVSADTQVTADFKVSIPTWNNDFLLASLYQPGKNTGTNANVYCENIGSTAGAENVVGVDAGFPTAGIDLKMKHNSNKEKCTWFLASQGDSTASHSSSFQLIAAGVVKYQLHWVEWQKGNIASTNLLGVSATGAVEDANFFPKLMPHQVDFQSAPSGTTKIPMEWPMPLKKANNVVGVAFQSLQGVDPPFRDSHTLPSWGPTKGYLAFLSGNMQGAAKESYSLVDFNMYNTFRADYNKQVAAYNTAAKTYSDAAKKYSDDVAARKKQLADPMNASFATPVVIPKVPCLNYNKPAAWAGASPYSDATTVNAALTAITTQADRPSKFTYAYPKAANEWNTPAMQISKTADPGSGTGATLFNHDFKAGFVLFNTDASVVAGAGRSQVGVNHVFGLLGQGTTDTAVTTTTFTAGLKAHRWSAPTNAQPNYMMVSLFPYSKVTADYQIAAAAVDVDIKAFKNDWDKDMTTFTIDTATAPANEVKEADQYTGAKALIATATAFAAVAMTLQ